MEAFKYLTSSKAASSSGRLEKSLRASTGPDVSMDIFRSLANSLTEKGRRSSVTFSVIISSAFKVKCEDNMHNKKMIILFKIFLSPKQFYNKI